MTRRANASRLLPGRAACNAAGLLLAIALTSAALEAGVERTGRPAQASHAVREGGAVSRLVRAVRQLVDAASRPAIAERPWRMSDALTFASTPPRGDASASSRRTRLLAGAGLLDLPPPGA